MGGQYNKGPLKTNRQIDGLYTSLLVTDEGSFDNDGRRGLFESSRLRME